MKANSIHLSLGLALIVLLGCSTGRKLNGTEQGAVIEEGTGVVVGDTVYTGVGGAIVGGKIGAVGGGLIKQETDEKKHHEPVP
jgi:hypothetical protein